LMPFVELFGEGVEKVCFDQRLFSVWSEYPFLPKPYCVIICGSSDFLDSRNGKCGETPASWVTSLESTFDCWLFPCCNYWFASAVVLQSDLEQSFIHWSNSTDDGIWFRLRKSPISSGFSEVFNSRRRRELFVWIQLPRRRLGFVSPLNIWTTKNPHSMIVVRTFSRGLVVRWYPSSTFHCWQNRLLSVSLKSDRGRQETIWRHGMVIGSRPEKVRAVIVSLETIHKFVHLSLEEHDVMMTWPRKSFSILN
jgi:hypothetical protein